MGHSRLIRHCVGVATPKKVTLSLSLAQLTHFCCINIQTNNKKFNLIGKPKGHEDIIKHIQLLILQQMLDGM